MTANLRPLAHIPAATVEEAIDWSHLCSPPASAPGARLLTESRTLAARHHPQQAGTLLPTKEAAEARGGAERARRRG
jgi:hypothetical protein